MPASLPHFSPPPSTPSSTHRAYINFHSLYILWLCSAVFYHLPSLETIGLDAKADLSLFIVVFVATLAVSNSTSMYTELR